MRKKKHIKIHRKLHKALDKLVADWTSTTGKLPSKNNVMDLIRWSYQQTISPKKIKKQIVVGTYQYEELPNNMFKKTDACGGTNYWDILIKKAGLVGKKLKVVLMVDNRKS